MILEHSSGNLKTIPTLCLLKRKLWSTSRCTSVLATTLYLTFSTVVPQVVKQQAVPAYLHPAYALPRSC